jgi:hypothetical protein
LETGDTADWKSALRSENDLLATEFAGSLLLWVRRSVSGAAMHDKDWAEKRIGLKSF